MFCHNDLYFNLKIITSHKYYSPRHVAEMGLHILDCLAHDFIYYHHHHYAYKHT